MNVNFEIAIYSINHGEYDKAIESLNTAIKQETEHKNEKTAIEYTCVLGELYADLGKKKEAEQEFLKVIEYCDRTDSLHKQRDIATDFLDLFHGKTKLVTEAPEAPRNVMGLTSKGFIAKNQRKRGKK